MATEPSAATASSAQPPLGVLLCNLGTPDAPTATALRRYLREFLWDPRVVEAPRALWWFVLNGVILRIRPRRSAEAYEKVWAAEGSPLLSISRRQSAAVQQALSARLSRPVRVALGMRYGRPSIRAAWEELKAAGCEQLLLLPLYPQYSASTNASTFDALAAAWLRERRLADLHYVRDYHAEPGYIAALAESVREHWAQHGRGDKLLLSFHGIPQRYAELGDPYPRQCRRTGELLAAELGLNDEQWMLVFQSRFGPQEWLQPYCDKTLEALPGQGVKRVDVLCPGFAADCLETLEEIAQTNRELFLAAGGEHFAYIPALNDRPGHIGFLAELIQRHLGPWLA